MPPNKKNEYGLTLLQERFCEEYLIDLNGTLACIRASYFAKETEVMPPYSLLNSLGSTIGVYLYCFKLNALYFFLN